MRLTIGKKLNGLIGLLLLLGVGLAVTLSVMIYTSNLTALVEKSVFDTSTIVTRNVRAEFRHIAEWSRALASASFEEFKFPKDRVRFIQNNLSVDERYVGMSLVLDQKTQWRILNPKSLKTHLSRQDFETLDQEFPVRLTNQQPTFVLARLSNGMPLIRMGLPFLQRSDSSLKGHLIIELQQERLTSIFQEITQGTSFLLTRDGLVLASSHPGWVPLGKNLGETDFFRSLQSDSTKKRLLTYQDADHQEQIAAYQKVGISDLVVVTQIPRAVTAKHQKEIARRSAFLAAALLCVALIFGVLFSQSITSPIRRLAIAAEEVKKGNFSVRLGNSQHRGDEIQSFSATFDEMVQGLTERDHLRSTFHKFHSREIAEKILAGKVALGGERISATVLFSDIRGFTSTSERLAPEALVQILNRYLTAMVRVIHQYGGVVDKYIGDAILAVWGAPIAKPEDTRNAVYACLAMRKALTELNQELVREGSPTLKIGMGLNYGPLVAGNIGSEEHMEYTVIGDTVNTASRIESVTKQLGVDLLVSESVFEQTSGQFLVQKAHQGVRLKGKMDLVSVYSVQGFINAEGRPVNVPSGNHFETSVASSQAKTNPEDGESAA